MYDTGGNKDAFIAELDASLSSPVGSGTTTSFTRKLVSGFLFLEVLGLETESISAISDGSC